MGYNSKIRIVTTKGGFDKLYQHSKEKLKDSYHKNLLDSLDIKRISSEDENVLLFGWDWLKWYEEFDSVKAIMEGLKLLEDEDIPYHYIRIGESEGDVEEILHDAEDTLPWLSTAIDFVYDDCFIDNNHYILFSCNEWKEYSSAKLVGVFTKDVLLRQLSKEVREGSMILETDKPVEDLSVYKLNNVLKYGFIATITINEAM